MNWLRFPIPHSPSVLTADSKPKATKRKTFCCGTYTENKDYVFEKYSLKVSSLYIAKAKESCGITERKCYNHGKEGHRVPNCPADKMEAILDAFRFFKMIPQT